MVTLLSAYTRAALTHWPPDIQVVLGADPHGGNVLHPGPQTRTLRQGPTARVVPRAARRHLRRCVPPSRRQDLDLCQRRGHLLADTEEPAYLPAQPSVLHRVCRLVRPIPMIQRSRWLTKFLQGPHWTFTSIRAELDISPASVCARYRRRPPAAVLVLATTVSEQLDQVHQHAGHPQRRVEYPARHGDQLLGVVCCRRAFPVLHKETQFCVVEQV
jgi:hypothetical protein